MIVLDSKGIIVMCPISLIKNEIICIHLRFYIEAFWVCVDLVVQQLQ